MKKVLIGSVLTLVSSLWAIAISVYVQLNLVMDWYGSRFWASATPYRWPCPCWRWLWDW